MSSIKKLVNQTAIYGISSIVGRLLYYFLVPLHTSILSEADYGNLSLFYVTIGFTFIILSFQFETTFFKFANKDFDKKKLYNTTSTTVLLNSLIFIGLVYFFSVPLSQYFGVASNPEFVNWFAVIAAIDIFTSLPFAKLRNDNKPVKFVIVKIVNISVNVLLNLFFLLLCPYLVQNYDNQIINHIYQPSFGIGYIVLSNLIASIVTLIMLYKEILVLNLKIDIVLFKKLMLFSFPLIIAGLAGMVNEMMDRYFLDYFLVAPQNVTDVMEYKRGQIGIYSANYKLSIFMSLFTQTFRYAADPFFFSKAGDSDAKETYAKILKYFIAFGILIFIGIMFYIDIFKFFIGEKFRVGLFIVPILLLANLFLGIIYNLSFWYKIISKTSFALIITSIGAAITIILNVMLIPVIGYVGSAWATLACYLSMTVLSLYFGSKYYPIPYNYLKIFMLFLSGTILYSINYLTCNNLTIFTFFFKGFLILVYMVIAFYILGLNKQISFQTVYQKVLRRNN